MQNLVKVQVDVVKKTIYEFIVTAVLDSDGDIDINATEEKAAEEYERALQSGTLDNHYYDEDYEYRIGDEI